MDYYELWGWYNWIKGWLSPIEWYNIEWEKVDIGLNIDMKGLIVEDFRKLTYREFENEMRAYYFKKVKGIVRKEIHAYNVKLPITELIKSLRGDMPLGVSDLKHEIKILREGIETLSTRDKRIIALMDKLLILLSDLNPKLAVIKYGK
jgi:hypothetical protein